jgi:hypothetical protein
MSPTRSSCRTASPLVPVAAIVLMATSLGAAQKSRPVAAPPDVAGVYRSIANETTLAGGLRNSGSPEDIALVPAAAEQTKSVDLTQDPDRLCQPIGPFRMMAREGTKIELAYGRGAIVMLFEDLSHGHMRTIHMTARPQAPMPAWQGHSIARWEGTTLVVDTSAFNERTWLNSSGAQHSDRLRLIEQVRPILGGRYLEYRVTVDDPQVLAKPYTYTRYFEKVPAEIQEDVCEP